jgi:hypothetical protein
MDDVHADQLFYQGRYDEAGDYATKKLESVPESSSDGLLYLMDGATALHAAGRYESSNALFERADRLSAVKDYTSLSQEGATLVVSDNMKDYKGEDFEKVLLNTYKAMNYALMNNIEDALVEAKLVNHKLHLYITEAKKKYSESAFARYLSAILYEQDQNFSDAYIDYKNTYALVPNFADLGGFLWKTALKSGNDQDCERWEQEFKIDKAVKAELMSQDRHFGELIVLYENGLGPLKKPNPEFKSLPKFVARYNPASFANVKLDGAVIGRTTMLENIEQTAILNLEEKYGGLIAKKIAGMAVKGGLAYAVGSATKSEALGLLTFMLLESADKADLRSWQWLPHDLQIGRFYLRPGTYKVSAQPQGAHLFSDLNAKTVVIKLGQKSFVNFRFVP